MCVYILSRVVITMCELEHYANMFYVITGVFFVWVGWFCPFSYQTLTLFKHTHTWGHTWDGDSEQDRVNADSLAKQMFISISECSCEAIRVHYQKTR